MNKAQKISTFLVLSCLIGLVLYPSLDLSVSGLFYNHEEGFFLANNPLCVAFHNLAYYGSRVLGVGLAILAILARFRHTSIFTIDAKGWSFLFLALMIGPVLLANIVFKDHWGRARPREIVAFGGTSTFSPALIPQSLDRKNSSFVSGDGAFGFFLPSFAYVVTQSRSRRTFWLGLGGGVLFGGTRIVMGAHFLSDVLFAAFFMLVSSALIFGVMYDWPLVRKKWGGWFRLSPNTPKEGYKSEG